MKLLGTYFFRLFRFLAFYWKAKTKYDVHSPFLASFCEEVLEDRRHYYSFDEVERLRTFWIRQNRPISLDNLGAQSKSRRSKKTTTGELARHSSIRPEFGRILFKLCLWLKPRKVLELGTHLGIGTCYLAKGAAKASIHSIEGNASLLPMIQDSLRFCRIEQVKIHQGLFDDQLIKVLDQLQQVDFIYLDGDHRGSATKANLKATLPYLQPGACVVLDDIYWSKDMQNAWQEIKSWSEFQASVDLFQFGILFIRPEIKEPVHIALVPWKWKFWRMGFF